MLLTSHVRAVVATLGGQRGAARRADQWRYLYAGFTVWLSQTEASGELLPPGLKRGSTMGMDLRAPPAFNSPMFLFLLHAEGG